MTTETIFMVLILLVIAVLFNIKRIKNVFSSKCPKCQIGRVSHSYSEPIGFTTIEVYECDNCNNKFV